MRPMIFHGLFEEPPQDVSEHDIKDPKPDTKM
jgi:hypothetical protein